MSHAPTPLGKRTVLRIHAETIARFGGMGGLRDEGLLDSALAQPFQTFAGEELYPTIAQKAARYAYGIISDHPFADGNKRTGTAVMAAFLLVNSCTFAPAHEELYRTMMGVAEDCVSFEQLATWVEGQIARS